MSETLIKQATTNSVVNVVLDTLEKKKQALVFVGTKRSAERVADDIAKQAKELPGMHDTAEIILNALSKPTKQCERLARVIKKGVAFHHAGLNFKQRELIEKKFREGTVKVIACTPTLAYGLDLPAFRVVIRDVKRYGQHGMGLIPVLDYMQMAGRAGRPKFDKYGEAVLIADNEGEAQELVDRYVNGAPEDIFSKLAVEPVLRTYVLSLIATRLVKTHDELIDFFSRTFWAYQFQDMPRLEGILEKMIGLLQDWQFIEGGTSNDFVSADKINRSRDYKATLLGQRVAQLYLDPLTAHELIVGINRAAERTKISPYAILHLLANRLEMRPVLRVGTKEWETYENVVAEEGHALLEQEPSLYDPEYDEFLGAIKTAKMLDEWMDERTEDYILEKFNVRPGELSGKMRNADWLLYACSELAKLVKHQKVVKEFNRVRFRLKYGVREELLALLKIEGVGRVRARIMFNAGIKTLADVKKVDLGRLGQLLGRAIAARVKRGVGEDVPEPAKDTKRKGQMSLGKYG